MAAEDGTAALSDAPPSPAKSVGSMSGMSDAIQGGSSCDDMGASASDSAVSDSERRAKKKSASGKQGHCSGIRRRRLSSSHKLVPSNPLDSGDEAGQGGGRSLAASSGRKMLARYARLDSSGSDQDVPEAKAAAVQEAADLCTAEATMACSDDDDNDLAASPDKPAHGGAGKIRRQLSGDTACLNEDQAPNGDSNPAEPVPVHDEAVDLFDSDASDVEDHVSEAAPSDDEAAAETAPATEAGAQSNVLAEGETAPFGGRSPPPRLTSSKSKGMPARTTSARNPKTGGDSDEQAAMATEAEGQREASPASTRKSSSGDDDIAAGDLEMADAEAADTMPAADDPSIDNHFPDVVSLNALSGSNASEGSPEDADDEAESPAGQEQGSSPQKGADSARSLDGGQTGPPDADHEMALDVAEEDGADRTSSALENQKSTPTPTKELPRETLLSNGKAISAAKAHAEAASCGEAARAEGEAPVPSKQTALPEHRASSLAEDAPEAEREASPPPRLTSKKTAGRSMLGRLSLDVGKLWPFNRNSKQQAPAPKPVEGTPQNAAGACGMTEPAVSGRPPSHSKAMDQHKSGQPDADANLDGEPTEGMVPEPHLDNASGAQPGKLATPRAASADDDEMPLTALTKKANTPLTGGRSSATPKGIEKRHGVSSSKRKGQRSSARLAGRTSKQDAGSPVKDAGSPVKGHLIQSNDEVSAGWKVQPPSPLGNCIFAQVLPLAVWKLSGRMLCEEFYKFVGWQV